MTPLEKMNIMAEALRQIGAKEIDPGASGTAALIEAQTIAENARRKAGLLPRKGLPFAKLKALQD